MFTILNTVLLVVLLVQIVKTRHDIQEIDFPDLKKK